MSVEIFATLTVLAVSLYIVIGAGIFFQGLGRERIKVEGYRYSRALEVKVCIGWIFFVIADLIEEVEYAKKRPRS